MFRFSSDIRSLKTLSSWRRRGVLLLPPQRVKEITFEPLLPPPPLSFTSFPCLNTNIRGQVWALSASDQTGAAAGYARLRTVGLIGLEAPR